MSLIKIKNASLGYEGKTVVNDISVDIKEKDYICIVGENGSGKTTLMKALLGLLKPLSGSITYSDGLKQNEIGYLPQSSDIQRDFPASVQEVVLSGCLNKKHTFFYSKEQKKTAAENMKLTGIYDLRKKCFRELSGGQRQRVMLARALCATHKLIILDEPVTGLDPMAMADMYALIKKLNESGITIIMVSHDVNSAVSNASKILHLAKNWYFYGTAHQYLHSDAGKRFILSDCPCDECQHILCLSTGRGFLVFQHLFLYIVEKLCGHNGGNRIGNQNITIFQLPDVAAIVQHMLNGVEGHQPATLVLDALFVQPIPNFPHGLAIVVPLEGFCHKGSSQRVDFKAVVCVDDVAKGNGTASELSLQCVFGHATNDLFRQVSGIILGITFQHRFQNDALRSLGDDLGGRHELDTVLLQLGLVPGTVVAVPGKTIQLPDQHDVKQLLVTVLNHLLKLRAVVRLGRDSTVNVVLDDGDAVLFRIGSAFTNLAFNGFFALVIR